MAGGRHGHGESYTIVFPSFLVLDSPTALWYNVDMKGRLSSVAEQDMNSIARGGRQNVSEEGRGRLVLAL
jgi:hypothetical protein